MYFLFFFILCTTKYLNGAILHNENVINDIIQHSLKMITSRTFFTYGALSTFFRYSHTYSTGQQKNDQLSIWIHQMYDNKLYKISISPLIFHDKKNFSYRFYFNQYFILVDLSIYFICWTRILCWLLHSHPLLIQQLCLYCT